MTQSPPEDKSRPQTEERPSGQEPEDEGLTELVEAVASAYFGACRKMARLFNRNKR